jgi:enoyl-CoA hydratase/carnithine racemase
MTTETIRADRFGDPDRRRCHLTKHGKVALLTIEDENLNGYTYRMFRDLDDCILQARFDPDVEAIVITGAGEHFCAGANIKMLEAADTRSKYFFCLHANETLLRLEHTPKLVIAAINGHCVGGGFEIALACDLRVARAAGGRIGLPEVNLGVLPGTGGTQRLTRLVGPAKAMEMMVSGATFDTAGALDAGLIHSIRGETAEREIKGKLRTVAGTERDAFVDEVIAYAQTFCTPGRAGLAVGHIKRAVQTGGALPLESGLALERELQATLFASRDADEGLQAFVQKRRAAFENR